jgi:hypothetical protein
VAARSPIPALLLSAGLCLSAGPVGPAQKDTDVPRLLLRIRAEVVELEKRPGEDFVRGEFFLGEGDDDTNKTHAVGILVREEEAGSKMTLVVSRLEPSRDDPRVKYARDPRTVICTFPGPGVEMIRSDYADAELRRLLPAVLRAVIDKKNLLGIRLAGLSMVLPPFPGFALEAAREFAVSTCP